MDCARAFDADPHYRRSILALISFKWTEKDGTLDDTAAAVLATRWRQVHNRSIAIVTQ